MKRFWQQPAFDASCGSIQHSASRERSWLKPKLDGSGGGQSGDRSWCRPGFAVSGGSCCSTQAEESNAGESCSRVVNLTLSSLIATQPLLDEKLNSYQRAAVDPGDFASFPNSKNVFWLQIGCRYCTTSDAPFINRHKYSSNSCNQCTYQLARVGLGGSSCMG